MSTIGHNGGPTLEGGYSWRRHAWRRARADLLPNSLPVEVVRTRVRRAAELGLDYRTYASVRAASGHDVVAFLFSSNALRLLGPAPRLPGDRVEKLSRLAACGRIALAQAPLDPARVMMAAPQLDAAYPAPAALAAWPEARAALRAALDPHKLPGDRVVLVGDLGLERDWSAAAGLAYYLPADRFFAQSPAP
ncbi:hypothetical protein U879_06575 [Defluviimonas sp. 20V17]|uniref:Uncharacterized protein n=1 Tax=Allgaiera indica TaxID=765699 RepID=A0AAN4UW92_9RHOB|nr:hypothetical protein [Allgaiera indica]KDB04482.1 hypothetical protein U879_06575 [Defluviimonas sp. 20V17]GHE06156.1 hypothetical protein GCM10008024_39650 [Allgaiera indica]SDX86757.1 hypothetical protein SAMN05444006_13525 [Allgaiera indica]